MDVSTLLADPDSIGLVSFVSNADSITIIVRACQKTIGCPLCNEPSGSLHSNYIRQVADLPWHGVPIRLELRTRKFRCRNELCLRKVFCERLPQVVAAYARKTVRLDDALILLAFALGSEAGARTARGLRLTVSGDTLLRRIYRRSSLITPDLETPKVLGVDDFAFRRGQRYGTILVDLEKRKVFDLLADREADTLCRWLTAHPGVEVISRDRAGAYADGARRGAPQAKQVADRWHLLKNATEVFEKTINRHQRLLKEIWVQIEGEKSVENEPPETVKQEDQSSKEPVLSTYHQQRKELYELVKWMQAEGLSINQIRLQINRHHTTVARFCRAAEYPLTTRAKGSRLIRPFAEYLRTRWNEGCRSAKQLYLELRELGYRGSDVTVRRATTDWREAVPILIEKPPPKLPPARSIVWLLLKSEEKLTDEEKPLREKIAETSEEISKGLRLLESFREMVRERKSENFENWLKEAAESGLAEFENFVVGLTEIAWQ